MGFCFCCFLITSYLPIVVLFSGTWSKSRIASRKIAAPTVPSTERVALDLAGRVLDGEWWMLAFGPLISDPLRRAQPRAQPQPQQPLPPSPLCPLNPSRATLALSRAFPAPHNIRQMNPGLRSEPPAYERPGRGLTHNGFDEFLYFSFYSG